jgi:hypothetical protein
MGLLLSKTLSKSLLSVGSFFAVSAITSSFQICFGPMNYQSQVLHVLLQIKVERSTSFR